MGQRILQARRRLKRAVVPRGGNDWGITAPQITAPPPEDTCQANMLEPWLEALLAEYGENVLRFDADAAQVCGRLRVPHPENPLDKQISTA